MAENTVKANVAYGKDQVLAWLTRDENGDYFIENISDGVVTGPLKLCEGDTAVVLAKNDSNRKWIKRTVCDPVIAKEGRIGLVYKPTILLGPAANRVPNEKLIAYLPQELQDEYKAIIEEARKLMEADKAAPKSEVEKAQEAMERARAKYEKLLAMATQTNEEV